MEEIFDFRSIAEEILKTVKNKESSKRKRLVELLALRGQVQEQLAIKAQEKRKATDNNNLIVRASMEFSNFCRQNCSFCGMNVQNRTLKRYRMNTKELTEIIKDVAKTDITDLHLASGEDWGFKASALAEVIREAVKVGLEVTLVTGHRRLEDYRMWREVGASRYIMKVETTNTDLFGDARMGMLLTERVSHLLYLRSLGYKIGTGVISGLPRQTADDLASDIIFLKELKPDMASVSRFLPNSQSRYNTQAEGSQDTTLNFIAIIRTELDVPKLRIPAGTSLGRKQIDALNFGANIVSVHVTPGEYADLYSSYREENRIITRMEVIRLLSQQAGMSLETRPNNKEDINEK